MWWTRIEGNESVVEMRVQSKWLVSYQMNKLLVLPNHAEQFHLMKLYFILDVSLELYQLMKVLTPVLDKVAKKAFRPFPIIVFNIKILQRIWICIFFRSLDLSFNLIKVIENLGCLTKLKKLYLVQNKVSKIEGLQNLSQLEMLELGANKIRVSTKLVVIQHTAWR